MLRMSGDVLTLPPHAFVARTGTTPLSIFDSTDKKGLDPQTKDRTSVLRICSPNVTQLQTSILTFPKQQPQHVRPSAAIHLASW
jgi:hypothetical protein